MVVTAENGTVTFRGVKSGRAYTVDIYSSDVAAAPWTWNPSGAAGTGSLQYWIAPTTEDVVLEDVAIHTGQTVSVGAYFTQNQATKNGAVIRWLPFLDTIATRPKLAIRFPAGSQIGAVQF